MVELLAEEHATFLAAEAVHQWSTNGIYLRRPNYNPQDLLPQLATGSRGNEYQSAPASALFATLTNTLTN